MKYSLKKEYKHLLKEFDIDAWNEYQDSYSNDKVRVIFPGDNRNIARIYNTKDDVEVAKQKSVIDLEKDEEIQLNTISVINKGYLSCANKHTDKQLEKGSNEVKFKKTIINLINKYCENKLVSDIINFSENNETQYGISDKLKEYKEKEKENIIAYIYNEAVYSRDVEEASWPVSFRNYYIYLSQSQDNSKIKFAYDDFINSEDLKKNLGEESSNDLKKIKQDFTPVNFSKKEIVNDLDAFLRIVIELCIEVKISFVDFKINCKDLEEQEDDFIVSRIKKSDVLKAILYEYCDNVSLPTFISDVKELGYKKEIFRKECANIKDAISHLNNSCKPFIKYKGRGGHQGEAKGSGEFHVHALLSTKNACQKIEPDAILKLSGSNFPCSIKQYAKQKAESQTGGSMSTELRSSCYAFLNSLFKEQNKKKLNASDLTGENVSSSVDKIIIKPEDDKFSFITKDKDGLLKIDQKKRASCLNDYKIFKELIASEHDSKGIIAYYPKELPASQKHFNFISKEECRDYLTLARIPSNERISFSMMTSAVDKRHRLDRILLYLLDDKYKHPEKIKLENIVKDYNDSLKQQSQDSDGNKEVDLSHYRPQGKVLKEVYSHLFEKKILSEGGLAGHMMHPYEALDMTPRQIIDRIKEYSTSQSIIEKVDGQNLFFTVEQDGTLMFARNKEDMTHDDLVTKFTGHPAELPFVEGGNAIKNGVKQWLQSAGDAAEMEIREIFHPAGEIKSFINFEIMHPDKPNQIIYDEKYIVFHSIIDYVDGRKTVYSTNKSQRLEKVLRFMDSGVSASGFTLASNRTVNLNELTNVQIEDYVERIKKVANSLEITEDQFLGKGIENKIENEIKSLGIEISDKDLKTLYDFALYGEDISGNKIKSKDFTSNINKPDVTKLRGIGLTSANKALSKVQKLLSPFKEIFVDLGIDLLKGVKSAYMSDETNQMNIDLLKDKLETAIDDLIDYMQNTSENYWEAEAHRLRPHLDKVIDKDIDSIVSTAVEGGVYDYQGDLLKVTGGFAPLNQILGAAYRDKKGMFPTFKEKFMKQESNKRSLKNTYKILF
jgi:hypothetical protein